MSGNTLKPHPTPLSGENPPLEPVLETMGLCVRFPRAPVRALDTVSLAIERNLKWGIVGESGSGKTTWMRSVLGLVPPEHGQVNWFGRDIHHMGSAELRTMRARVQPVFQDPIASFDPRYRNRDILEEPQKIHGIKDPSLRLANCEKALSAVGLSPDLLAVHPRRMSGGQRQRLAIARVLTLQPEVLIADEPTAALDLSVQGQILSLFMELHDQQGLTLVFISHDLPLVAHLCDRVAVLYAGHLVETGPAEDLFADPMHPYTRDLLEASTGPLPPPSSSRLPGPSGTGCPYAARCRVRLDRCNTEKPALSGRDDRSVACHLFFH